MQREKIILSDLDLNILFYLKEERFVKDIIDEFNINYLTIKRHTNRLKEINGYSETKFATLKKLKITKTGEEILNALKWI